MILSAALNYFRANAVIFGVIAMIAWSGGIYIKGRVDGVNSCERKGDQAVKKETKRQREAADDLTIVEEIQDAKVTERIIYIERQAKPGTCLASDAPDDVITSLGGVHQPSGNR